MACPRGAAAPDAHTQRRLFAASGGFCQNPNCERPLFVEVPGKSIHIAEMAHVFAAGDRGPRANDKMARAERGSFDNLIMLCSLCHTIVDKAPDVYSDDVLLAWKRDHAKRLQGLFGAVEFEDRATLRAAIEPLLTENRSIFDQYGPHTDDTSNPESGAAERWHRKVITRIIPNNNRLLAILDKNRQHLLDQEKLVLEAFRQHTHDFESFHVEGYAADGSRFPPEMSTIARDL